MKRSMDRRGFFRVAAAGAAGVAAVGRRYGYAQEPIECDVVLRGGTLIDGTGAAPVLADVGIRRGEVAAIGVAMTGVEEVDCTGLTICPGFVDIHTHMDVACWPAPMDVPLPPHEGPYPELHSRMMLEQGITTVLAGNCGYSAGAIGAHLAALESEGVPFNYATLAGHATLREGATDLRQVQARLDEALREGAYGLSLNRAHGAAAEAETDELIALVRLVGAVEGGLLAVHRASETAGLIDATTEAITLGRMSGAQVQISHMRSRFEPNWPNAAAAYDLVEEARDAGIDVAADLYVHPGAGMTVPMAYLPPEYWVSGDREALEAARYDADLLAYVGERVALVDPTLFFPRAAAYEGYGDFSLIGVVQSLTTWDRPRNLLDQIVDLALSSEGPVRGTPLPPMGIYMNEMSLEAISQALARPFMMVASDAGGPANIAPQGLVPWSFSNTARLLGTFAGELEAERRQAVVAPEQPETPEEAGNRDTGQGAYRPGRGRTEREQGSEGNAPEASPPPPDTEDPLQEPEVASEVQERIQNLRVLPYPEAIRRMSAMPAERMGLANRGRIAPGMAADIVVLDLANTRDVSLPYTANARPRGIRRVYVNGRLVVADGEYNGERHGVILRRG